MNIATNTKPTHDHFVWETLDNIATLGSFVDEGLSILDNILREMGSAEPAGSAYMVQRIQEHTKALNEALSAAQDAFRGRVWIEPQSQRSAVQGGEGSNTAEPKPTPSLEMRTALSDFEDALIDMKGLAETIGHLADSASVIEDACLNFVNSRALDLWRELTRIYDRALDDQMGREATAA